MSHDASASPSAPWSRPKARGRQSIAVLLLTLACGDDLSARGRELDTTAIDCFGAPSLSLSLSLPFSPSIYHTYEWPPASVDVSCAQSVDKYSARTTKNPKEQVLPTEAVDSRELQQSDEPTDRNKSAHDEPLNKTLPRLLRLFKLFKLLYTRRNRALALALSDDRLSLARSNKISANSQQSINFYDDEDEDLARHCQELEALPWRGRGG